MRVGLIGTGAMGAPIGQRLLEAGHDLRVFNRRADRADPLVAAGAERAASAAEAARDRNVVMTVLTDADAVRRVVEGAEGAARGLEPGAVLIDVSTAGAAFARELRGLVPDGVAVLDAPVLGSRAEAAAGTLHVLAGGAREIVDRCRPVLAALGEVHHVGPAGAGAAAKLIANFALLGTLGVLTEAIALADALGLDRGATLQALAMTPLAVQADKRRTALAGDPGPARFALALAAKDAALVSEAATTAGLRAPVADAVRARLEAAIVAGLGDADYTAMLSHR